MIAVIRRNLLSMLVAWAIALVLTSVAVWLVGDQPLLVLKVLATSAFGSADNFSYTLFYATPLLLTGTAVALALEAGLFNIGAEGQLYMGALCAAAWGAVSRNWFGPNAGEFMLLFGPGLALFLGLAFSFAGGAAWGGLAGYLRTRRQVHEVIATIMLNFVAMALVNWAIVNPLKNPETQNLETYWVAEILRVGPMWHYTSYGLLLALALAIATLTAIKSTWWGFRVRATGRNEKAAALAGIPVSGTALRTMALSGGIAGLVGFNEVFLHGHRLVDSFSPGYGFTGLAIALLARGNIPALIVSALLFGGLHKGALDLDLETEKVTRDLSAVIQALILLSLAAEPRVSAILRGRGRKKGRAS